MTHILYIGIGGFFGAISRFIVSRYLNNLVPNFPLGTLTVNVAGTFVLGLIMYSIGYGRTIPVEMRDLITVGFIGAMTTMSTFSYETFRLTELNELYYAFLNFFLNTFLCFTAVYLSKYLAGLLNK